MHTCLLGSNCWVVCLLIFVGWWLISSGLLLLTWNKVIGALVSKVKPVKYWQALLFVATICIFCAPRHYFKHRYDYHSQCCHEQKEHCPYEHGDKDDGDEKQQKAN